LIMIFPNNASLTYFILLLRNAADIKTFFAYYKAFAFKLDWFIA